MEPVIALIAADHEPKSNTHGRVAPPGGGQSLPWLYSTSISSKGLHHLFIWNVHPSPHLPVLLHITSVCLSSNPMEHFSFSPSYAYWSSYQSIYPSSHQYKKLITQLPVLPICPLVSCLGFAVTLCYKCSWLYLCYIVYFPCLYFPEISISRLVASEVLWCDLNYFQPSLYKLANNQSIHSDRTA